MAHNNNTFDDFADDDPRQQHVPQTCPNCKLLLCASMCAAPSRPQERNLTQSALCILMTNSATRQRDTQLDTLPPNERGTHTMLCNTSKVGVAPVGSVEVDMNFDGASVGTLVVQNQVKDGMTSRANFQPTWIPKITLTNYNKAWHCHGADCVCRLLHRTVTCVSDKNS